MSAKLKGSANWLLQPNSPSIQKEQLSYVYVVTWAELWLGLAEYGSAPPNTPMTPSTRFGTWKLDTRSIVNMKGGLTAKVTYNYKSPEDPSFPDTDSNNPKYSCNTSTIEKGIATHDDYETRWNFCLAGKTGSSQPSWWETANDLITGDENYKWVKRESGLPEGWEILKDATKPDVEAYPYPCTVVTEKRYYSSSNSADNACAEVATRSVPGKKFGLGGDTNNWINMGASVSQEGRLWCASVNYQYVDKIDEDIYS